MLVGTTFSANPLFAPIRAQRAQITTCTLAEGPLSVLWPKTPDFTRALHTDVQIPMTAIPFYVARRNLKKLHKSPKMSNDNALHITPLKADVGCQSGLCWRFKLMMMMLMMMTMMMLIMTMMMTCPRPL